jgi:hypothetical protein
MSARPGLIDFTVLAVLSNSKVPRYVVAVINHFSLLMARYFLQYFVFRRA